MKKKNNKKTKKKTKKTKLKKRRKKQEIIKHTEKKKCRKWGELPPGGLSSGDPLKVNKEYGVSKQGAWSVTTRTLGVHGEGTKSFGGGGEFNIRVGTRKSGWKQS